MIIVVDTNVIIAAVLKQSITQDLLFHPHFRFYAPEFVKDEIEKYQDDLIKKSGYNAEKFYTILSLVFSRITIIPQEEYMKYKDEVLDFSPDKDDWPFLALAKHLMAGLWTYDNDLRTGQHIIKTFTTAELVQMCCVA